MPTLHRTSRRASRPHTALIALFVAVAAAPANAQMLVNDPVVFGGQMQQITKDAVEFGKQAERWSETYSHYRRQLIGLQRMNFGQTAMSDSFPPRPHDYGLDDACPGAAGLRASLDGALNQAMPKMDGNIVDEQQAICQRMVFAENAKYNESVRMLRTLIQRSRQFEAIEGQRDGVGDQPGALAANDNEAQRFLIRTSMDLDYWQARMKAYSDYIESLKWDQSRLAKRALQGRKGGIQGEVVQALALKAALSR